MKDRVVGIVQRVNGPVIVVRNITDAMMMELVHVGESGLIGEIMKLSGSRATIQVYEDTTGITPGDPVYGTGMPLSVELGPGLIGQIYDGIQRPLVRLKETCGIFIERGIEEPALERNKKWHFVPLFEKDSDVKSGLIIATAEESQRVEHRIMVPPGLKGSLIYIVPEGEYTLTDEVAKIRDEEGVDHSLTMLQRWPIR